MAARASTGLPPGRIKLYDATAMMLRVVAERVAPDAAKALRAHMLALHAATGENWDAVIREATAVRARCRDADPGCSPRTISTKRDAKALANGVVAERPRRQRPRLQRRAAAGDGAGSIVAAMKALGFADDTAARGAQRRARPALRRGRRRPEIPPGRLCRGAEGVQGQAAAVIRTAGGRPIASSRCPGFRRCRLARRRRRGCKGRIRRARRGYGNGRDGPTGRPAPCFCFEIRSLPAFDAGRLFDQRRQPLRLRRIAPEIEPVEIERRFEIVDVDFGDIGLGAAEIADHRRQRRARSTARESPAPPAVRSG